VVNGADTVSVTLKDRRTFEEVLGKIQSLMLLLSKKANNLPVIALGNSDVLQPGEWVIAIGNLGSR